MARDGNASVEERSATHELRDSLAKGGEFPVEAVTQQSSMATHELRDNLAEGGEFPVEAVTSQSSMASSMATHELRDSLAKDGEFPVEAVTQISSMASDGLPFMEADTYECEGGMAEDEVSPMEITYDNIVPAVDGHAFVDAASKAHEFEWPGHLVLRIMAFLPFLHLLYYRVVSRDWNAMMLNPNFQQLREGVKRESILQEFFRLVIDKCCSKNWHLKFDCMAGGLLTMLQHEDVFVLEPLRLSMRKLPRLKCTTGVGRLQELLVVGVVVSKATRNFALFVVSMVRRTPSARGGDGVASGGRGPAAVGLEMNLHRYNSTTNVWTVCGKGLDLDSIWRKIESMTIHRGQYMALVKNNRGPTGTKTPHFTYEVYYFNEFRWSKLPGRFPGKFPHPEKVGVSIFDHGGILYLAKPSASGCSLWRYNHGAIEWVFVREFRSPIPADVESPSELLWDKRQEPYSALLGDYLHFGEFVRSTTKGAPDPASPCWMLMYNLVTGTVKDVDMSDKLVQCLEVKRYLEKGQERFFRNINEHTLRPLQLSSQDAADSDHESCCSSS